MDVKQSTHPYNGGIPRGEPADSNRTRPPYWPQRMFRHKILQYRYSLGYSHAAVSPRSDLRDSLQMSFTVNQIT